MDKENNTEEFQAYTKAAELLNRSEHCRFLLRQKLSKRGFSDEAIDKALDSLEREGSLSDNRYAAAWIRTRALRKYEGRSRLAAELTVRGIDRETAQAALDAFFEETTEESYCQRAAEKYCHSGKKTPEQTLVYLLRMGFPSAMIRRAGIIPDKRHSDF
ncbi:MAG: recombination regulator RecX [Treponema sp.]|jgi:regulatory protein|nr:recombination regulator RecX [Treponema sp.]